ncbi:hypothetical protein [Helicobacter sp. MIT 14-3879]|uniref:hypothetical protein n=1 Tax=Helicobacter sp. MIT 14-3879 TaxID=2040649 RepID=UPI000E1EBF90|nr:hypothetical protein [Helicobacter sp. MIT 14-3879]RDU64800.1 hypothetical protein CQA44_03565 [Helicobacter sp. MIT 14-3879]
MNLILAVLSFFSAVMLPGAVIYKLIFKKFDFALFITISFIFSLCFNLYLIYILSLCGIYNQNIVVGIFVIEIILFLFLFRFEILRPLDAVKLSNDYVSQFLFTFGVLLTLYFLNKVFKADIFYAWDAVVSWDRWASEWASGKFVLNEGGYPQVYPMLLSLGYVASQKVSSFQGIGVAIYHYFIFAGIVSSIFLFNSNKYRIFGIISTILIYVVFFRWSNEFYVGYVDLPVAMIILISALSLLKAVLLDCNECNETCKITSPKTSVLFYLLFSSLCAGLSTEVKQAGLFWCIAFVFSIFYFRFYKKISYKILLTIICVMLFFIFPWIAIAIYKKIFLNIDATNADYVMNGIFLGKGYLERFSIALKRYEAISILFFISIFAIKDRIFRFYSICGIIYFVFWGTHLSYDLRNLQGGLPLMIIAFSGTIICYFDIVTKAFLLVYKRIPIIFICIVLFGCIFAYFSQEKILQSEYKRKMTLGGKEVNELVLNTFKNNGAKVLLTSNQLIAFVPAMDRQYYKLYHFGPQIKDGEFEKYAIALKDEIGSFYILLPKDEFKRYERFFEKSNIIGEVGYYTLVEY